LQSKRHPLIYTFCFLFYFSYYKGLPLADLQATEPYYQNHHYDVMNRLISTCDLISWSFQIARGMNYLVSKNVCALWGVILTVIKISGLKWVEGLISYPTKLKTSLYRYSTAIWRHETFCWPTTE
jgi:hypothetical protein